MITEAEHRRYKKRMDLRWKRLQNQMLRMKSNLEKKMRDKEEKESEQGKWNREKQEVE